MLYLINLQTVSFQSCGPVPAKIALVALIKKDRGPEAQTRPADALEGPSPLLLPPVLLNKLNFLIHMICLIMHYLLNESTGGPSI